MSSWKLGVLGQVNSIVGEARGHDPGWLLHIVYGVSVYAWHGSPRLPKLRTEKPLL